jgi:hypothetical protein
MGMGRLTSLVWTIVAVATCSAALPTAAQDKKKSDKKSEPRVIVAVPLGLSPGTTTKITLRGIRLDKATLVKVEGDRGQVRIISKEPVALPDKFTNPEKVGDSEVVAEVTLPKKFQEEAVTLVVVTPEGTTKPHKLLVDRTPVTPEKEPNDGFKQAQQINLPVVIEGMIDRPRDVDVFRFSGKKGQKITAEVLAHRYGSTLDAMLTLYNAIGQQVAFNDDLGPETRDARLQAVLPADGDYLLVLIDAYDTGGPAHAYRLVVK